jgi:hypothetical protein
MGASDLKAKDVRRSESAASGKRGACAHLSHE